MSPQVCWLWLPTQVLLGVRVQAANWAANWAAKLGAWCRARQPGGYAVPHRLVRGFEHADKVGRGCRSKLAWVLVGQHRFGRGSREVHWTWHQTGTSAGCAETLSSVPEGLNGTAPGFLRLGGGSSLCSVSAV